MATPSANDDATGTQDEVTVAQSNPGKHHISTDVQTEPRPGKIPRLLSPEEAELNMTVAICEAAWEHREELEKTATTQQEIEDAHYDEVEAVRASSQGLRYSSAQSFMIGRVTLLRYNRKLVAFEGHLFPREMNH